MTSLDMAVREIELALQAKLYYLALVSTLSLIDICAALEDVNGKTDQPKYKAWYDKNLSMHYEWLSAQDCYGLRCGILHQGVMDHSVKNKPPSQWSRIAFLLPDERGNQFRQLVAGDFYITGLAEFCRDVVSRVQHWVAATKDDPIVKKNSENLLRLHPNGIRPYLGGMALLA